MANPLSYQGYLPFAPGSFPRSQPFPQPGSIHAAVPAFFAGGFGPLFCFDSVLPSGVLGLGYSQTLTAGGGTAPYSFALASGYALPPGLSLNGTTGVISGTPTAVGTFVFNLTLTDARPASTTQTFAITVGAAISSTSFNSGYAG